LKVAASFVVAVDVLQERVQLAEHRFVDRALGGEAVVRPLLQLVEVPALLGHADDGQIELPLGDERRQRRKICL
jgi:hypothetical protein